MKLLICTFHWYKWDLKAATGYHTRQCSGGVPPPSDHCSPCYARQPSGNITVPTCSAGSQEVSFRGGGVFASKEVGLSSVACDLQLARLPCPFVQLCCGEGGTLQTNITGMCGECLQCLGHTGFAPAHGMCAFLVYTAQAQSYSAWELSKAGPGFCTLPRSELLRFRFSGTTQRHRLSWSCVLCPSQV